MAFKAKDLHYDHDNEPAFLRRIRAQNSGLDDRHERPVARPKRVKVDDEDDAPTYVTQDGNETLGKEDYEKLMASENERGRDADGAGEETPGVRGKSVGSEPKASGALPVGTVETGTDEAKKTKPVTEAGLGSKKRKVARVVGEESDDDQVNGDQTESKVATKTKPKKKAKPIKLSFGDDEAA